MTQPSSTCDPSAIERFLDDDLDATQQTIFERHLDECDECCERLQSMTAAQEQWSDVQSLMGISGPSTGACDEPRATPNVSLDFLAPTDDPRMLGRFGGYEIAGLIGVGGMGIVLKGFDVALNRYAAIKVLAPHYASSVAARQRFAREAQAAAAVVHENVVAIHGVDEFANLPYLVMPYVRGESLQKRLDRAGTLSVSEVLRIAMQTALGLAAAHDQGLVHRDIKPANLLLPENVERVLITDFGLARAADDASLTRSGVIAGTPHYMSPEQARGDALDARSDLFSLGSVMYAMCTGRVPFRAETPLGVLRRITQESPRPVREINADLPLWLTNIIDRLHAKSPKDRYESAHVVAELLTKCIAHARDSTKNPLPHELVEVTAKQNRVPRRWWWRVAAAVTLAMVVGVVAWQLLPNDDRAAPATNHSPVVEVQPAEQVDVVLTPELPDVMDESTFDSEALERWDDSLDSVLQHVEKSLEELTRP